MSSIVDLMLTINPLLTWLDVQIILAMSCYAPTPSLGLFTWNAATDWNGGGMHFSDALGFGVVDANVAVNLAAAWTPGTKVAGGIPEDARNAMMVASEPLPTSANVVTGSTGSSGTVNMTGIGGDGTVTHIVVCITDTGLLASASEIVLVGPNGITDSILNFDAGIPSNALDISGINMTSNAFWGEQAAGQWTLEVHNFSGKVAKITDWTLTIWGDGTVIPVSGSGISSGPSSLSLVYTPEFAALAPGNTARIQVNPQGTSNTLDLIACPAQQISTSTVALEKTRPLMASM